MNEQKKSSPMNLDYLKHVRDYMITFSEYLGKSDPNSKMFQYALRYLPCLNEGRQVQFNNQTMFNDTIESISGKIKLLEESNRNELANADIDNRFIKSMDYANIVFAAWANRYNYQYLLK